MSTITEADFAADPIASLRAARESGGLLIEASDGAHFVLMLRPPEPPSKSLLDVGTVPGLRLSLDDILDAIQAGRERR